LENEKGISYHVEFIISFLNMGASSFYFWMLMHIRHCLEQFKLWTECLYL